MHFVGFFNYATNIVKANCKQKNNNDDDNNHLSFVFYAKFIVLVELNRRVNYRFSCLPARFQANASLCALLERAGLAHSLQFL